MDKSFPINRRRMLRSAAAGAVLTQLPGCILMPKPKPICPFDPRYTDLESPLTIDVHTHIFNAADLQVSGFIKRVAARQTGGLRRLVEYFGPVLQGFAWQLAPDAQAEQAALARLRPAIEACDVGQNLKNLADLQQGQYAQARDLLHDRVQTLGLSQAIRSAPFTSLTTEAQGARLIDELPATYTQFKTQQRTTLNVQNIEVIARMNAQSVLNFIIEMFQFRFVSAYNYLDTYQDASDLKIDLLTPALVDYDFWLAKGASTPSTLPEQTDLMGQISILTGGRVHMLVPFDPYRQVVFDTGGQARFSPLELVDNAVMNQGAVGVKLYPPMGFAPKGNSGLDLWRDKDWLTPLARTPDFGAKLDAAMKRLYEYCDTRGVPVMGHSNRSNGPAADFEDLTAPKYWRQAINDHGNVAISFGHFGGTGGASSSGEGDIRGFLELLRSDAARQPARIHADVSYFSNLLDAPDTLTDVLEAIYRFDPDSTQALVQRVMYGSDWKMLTVEENADRYLRSFATVIDRLEDRLGNKTNLRARFFGQNAAVYLGLQRGQRNRDRLDEFYARNRVAPPVWMKKVDDQMAARSA